MTDESTWSAHSFFHGGQTNQTALRCHHGRGQRGCSGGAHSRRHMAVLPCVGPPSCARLLWRAGREERYWPKGQNSSSGEVHRGSCSEDIHMEEEKVEVKVQEDEVEDGRDK